MYPDPKNSPNEQVWLEHQTDKINEGESSENESAVNNTKSENKAHVVILILP